MKKEISIAREVMTLVDRFVSTHSTRELRDLHELIKKLILAEIIDTQVSLIDINEFIEEAVITLENGKDSGHLYQSSLRKMIDQDLELK